jgi:hypothetical protein
LYREIRLVFITMTYLNLALDEGEQVGIDDVGLRRNHAVRVVLVGLQRAVLEEFGREWAGGLIGHDLVVFAMHDQDWHRDLLQILGEVGLRERDDPVVMRLGTAHHALPPPVPNVSLNSFHAGTVEAVEWAGRQVVIELGPVDEELGLEIVEHRFGQA